MDRTNVVLITCHDIGDFLNCYGTPVATPNLDRVAAEGVVFENHFSTSTVCSPARGAIATGCYPHTHGLMGLVHRGWELDVEKCPPLPTLLRNAGYQTLLFGAQHEHRDPARLGYDHVAPEAGRGAEAIARDFADWLGRRDRNAPPFLASVCFGEGHRAGMNPSHFRRDSYRPADPAAVAVPPWLPDIPEIREDLAWLYGALGYLDAQVGRVLDALDRHRLADRTLLLFTSDHGTSFIHAKATLYDGGTKVAFLARHPGALPAGRRVAALTSHVDILPTIFDHLSLPVPPHVQGRTALGLARQDAGPRRDFVFAERNYTNFFDPARMVRSDRFKYIRKGLRTCIFDFQIPEIELSAWDWRRNRAVAAFYSARRTTEELYDLCRDPAELHNVADDPTFADPLARLRRALDEHLEATDDPFRHMRIDLLMPADLMAATMKRG